MNLMSNLFKDFKKMEILTYNERKIKIEKMRILKEKENKANPISA